MNPRAHLEVFGQELNDESFAICRSDMMLKGRPNDGSLDLGAEVELTHLRIAASRRPPRSTPASPAARQTTRR